MSRRRKNKARPHKDSSKTTVMPVKLSARYDAAQTTRENSRYWSFADGFSADTAANLSVRKLLRQRSRYEVANNSYAKGIVLTLANDCVGTGPRLQLLSDDGELNRNVEISFGLWAKEISLAEKLRTMRMSKSCDGEVFAVLIFNEKLKSPIKLDLKVIEADRVTDPFYRKNEDGNIDGIVFDKFSNPVKYYILNSHPGDQSSLSGDYSIIKADNVIHWFRADRPSQHRGIPEITPALALFAQLRRYTLAVIAAAETAADFAAVLYTTAPADGEAAAVEPMDVVELEKRMATVLPDGWQLGQVKAEQPATSYGEFKREILNEIARCLNLPYNIAACNSSGYNYASGRLDHQTYYRAIRVEQENLSSVVLDKIFSAWVYEAMLLTPFAKLRRIDHITHQWFFDGTEHVDPAKEASAQATRLNSNTTTLAAEYARQGKDWEVEIRQIAKEKSLMEELGLVKVKETQNA